MSADLSTILGATNSTAKAGGTSTKKGISDGSSSLNMDDFLTLLVAQLKNQDMYNTMDNSEFMGQMAQFSMVQALTELNEQSVAAYSVSLIGKGATATSTNDKGMEEITIGVVQCVNFQNGEAKVVINGKEYPMSDVKQVYDASLIDKVVK